MDGRTMQYPGASYPGQVYNGQPQHQGFSGQGMYP